MYMIHHITHYNLAKQLINYFTVDHNFYIFIKLVLRITKINFTIPVDWDKESLFSI